MTTTKSPIFISPHQLSSLLSSLPNEKNKEGKDNPPSSPSPSVILIDTRPPESFAQSRITSPSSSSSSSTVMTINIPECFTYLAPSTTPAGQEATREYFRDLFSRRSGGVLSSSSSSSSEDKRKKPVVVFYEQDLLSGFGRACRGYLLLRWVLPPDWCGGSKDGGGIRVLEGGFEWWVRMMKGMGMGKMGINSTLDDEQEKWGEGEGEGEEGKEGKEGGEGEKEEEENIFIGVEDMVQILEKKEKKEKKTIFIDTRDPEEWHCESSSPYGVDFCPRKGRIPGAVWIGWRDMLEEEVGGGDDDDGNDSDDSGKVVTATKTMRMKNKDDILRLCEGVGVRRGKEGGGDDDLALIVYCFKGARASLSFVALKEAGFRNVRLYLGSWNEWSRDLGLPICGVEG